MDTNRAVTDEEYFHEFAKEFCGGGAYFDKKDGTIRNPNGLKVNPYSLDDVYRRLSIFCRDNSIVLNLNLQFISSSGNFMASIAVRKPPPPFPYVNFSPEEDETIILHVGRNGSVCVIRVLVDHIKYK